MLSNVWAFNAKKRYTLYIRREAHVKAWWDVISSVACKLALARSPLNSLTSTIAWAFPMTDSKQMSLCFKRKTLSCETLDSVTFYNSYIGSQPRH